MNVGDIIVIISTVVISLLIAFFTTTQNGDSDSFSFVVNHDGTDVLELTVEKDYKGVHEFRFSNYIGYVEIKSGKVRLQRMKKEVCPRQICSRLGWADRQRDILVCLPNMLVVEVKQIEGDKNYGADTISF